MSESNEPDTVVVGVPVESAPPAHDHTMLIERMDTLVARMDLLTRSVMDLQDRLVAPEEPEEPEEPSATIDVPPPTKAREKRNRRTL